MNEQANDKQTDGEKKPAETAKALPKSSLKDLAGEASESELAEQFYTVATTCW